MPWRPWATRERFEPGQPEAETHRSGAGVEGRTGLGAVTVLIPARNEAPWLAATLEALARQGPNLDVVVIDDQSTDATAGIAEREAGRLGGSGRDGSCHGARPTHGGTYPMRVRLVRGAPLPDGWAGKLWALEQGLGAVTRPHVLLLDADIVLGDGVLPGLLALARRRRAALVSVMATLNCETAWERLLVPAFIYFFKLLYPFALVNDPRRAAAAAAGGCILVETRALRAVGAFGALRSALIDDCSLAVLVKGRGHALWLGMSRSVRSRRRYARLGDFWRMVSRTAFTQLRYSAALLVLTVTAMLWLFAAPVLGLALWAAGGASPALAIVSGLGIAAMALGYVPVVRFYRLPGLWALTLPAAAMLFAAMTVGSAIGYWRGTRAEWKDRFYGVQ